MRLFKWLQAEVGGGSKGSSGDRPSIKEQNGEGGNKNKLEENTGKAAPFLEIFQERPELRGRVSKEFLKALKTWSWKEDQLHVNKECGLSVASAYYGQRFRNAQEIYEHAKEITGRDDIVDITVTSHFPELFQVTSGHTENEMLLTEMMIANRLIRKSVEGIGKKPEEVDLFIVATSVPSDFNLEKKLAHAAGIRGKTPIFLYVRACDSSGSALFDVISGKYDALLDKITRKGKPATVSIFGFEDANRLANRGGDPHSAQLFSSAASALTFFYHPNSNKSTFRLIAGQHSSIAEGADALQVTKSYKNWPNKANAFFAEHLIEPPDGQVILMDPRRTSVVFKNLGLKAVLDVLTQYAKKTEKPLDFLPKLTQTVIMHHPSGTIFDHVITGLAGRKKKTGSSDTGLGFSEAQFKWVISEGNAPSAVMPIALGRQLHEFNPGDTIMVLTYGAGGSFTCAFYKMGTEFK